MNLAEDMIALATAAKSAARLMPRLSTDQKNLCLNAMAEALETQTEAIQAANALDMETARAMKLPQSMMDRLLLNEQRITQMAQGLREVAALPDPVGRVLAETERPSGLKLKKIACPNRLRLES